MGLMDEIVEDCAAGGVLAAITERNALADRRADVDRALVALDAAKRRGDPAEVAEARSAYCDVLRALGRFVAEGLPPQDAEEDLADAIEALYHEAVAADDAFQAALEARYGAAAGDRRYQRTWEHSPRLGQLASAKRAADERYLAAVRAAREGER